MFLKFEFCLEKFCVFDMKFLFGFLYGVFLLCGVGIGMGFMFGMNV